MVKSDGITQNYLYLHRDYQGSILAITNANGTIVEKRLFDAWGSLINYYNATGASFGSWGAFDRGYTGHEHLTSVGLINMNARLYDPKLHRFLQPDNYVQEPFNTQNYNRYGYCWNNPLKFTDPSGEWIHLLIGAVVGGVVNWAANGCQFNAAGLGYFGTGAASGFVTALTGNPYLGAAIMGAGNSVTTQLSTTGKVDLGQVIQNVGMSVAMAGIGAEISSAIGPYMDKTVGSVVKNSILKESITQGVTNSVGGFVIGAGVAGANGASFNDAISSGWSSAKMGFAMGVTSGAVKGYIDVKAKTVSSKDNATQTQAKPTTQQNTASNAPANSNEPLQDLGKYPAGHVNTTKATETSTPNSIHKYTAPNGKPIQNTIYNIDGKASYQVDFKFHGQGTPHGHTIPIPGNLNSGHQGNHIPFMLVPKDFW